MVETIATIEMLSDTLVSSFLATVGSITAIFGLLGCAYSLIRNIIKKHLQQ